MKQRLSLLLVLGIVLVLGGVVSAMAAPKPAFVRAEIERSPLWSDDVLIIALEPDKEKCRQTYGDNWEELCAVYPGSGGVPVTGVTMSPDVPGEWHWFTADRLGFRPTKPWPVDTAFTVSLERLNLPARAVLNTRSINLKTPPLAAFAEPGEVWIDPRSDGERAVSFGVRFSSPPVRTIVEKGLSLKPEDKGLTLFAPEFVWMDDTNLLVKARVRQLAENETGVNLKMAGVRAIGKNEASEYRLTRGNAAQRVVVPGTKNLFRITAASLNSATTAGLNTEFRLHLQPSLQVSAEEVLARLKVIQLPAVQNPEATRAYDWVAAPAVTPDDLNRGTALTVVPVKEPGLGDSLAFRVPVAPGSAVFCELPAGFGPQKGLAAPWRAVFNAATPGPEVGFLQPGNVLALGGEHTLHIMAKGVTHVTWRASRVLRRNLSALDYTEPFQSPQYYEPNMDSVTDAVQGRLELGPLTDPTRARFATLDVDALTRNATGLMWVELTGYNGKDIAVRSGRLVLASNLGMVVKQTVSGGRDVFVCALSDGKPVSGASVEILGANGLPVVSARTDAQGKAVLPSVAGFEREKKPRAVVVSTQIDGKEDLAWMQLGDATRNVDYSRFPTSGKTTASNGINAYVFNQRGLYRPGETLYFGVILRRGDWKPLPADMPFAAALYDPAERVVMRRTFTGADGLSTQRWDVPETAPTGRYRLEITTPDAVSQDTDNPLVLGVGTALVEEFQPDTLSVKASVPQMGKGWLVTPDKADVRVELRNLYGLPAAGRKVSGHFMAGKPDALVFSGYETYTFPDALPWKGEPHAADLAAVQTDAAGLAALPLGLQQFRNGTLQCTVQVSGFEPDGGRAVDTATRFLLSPLPYMLGYRLDGAVGNLDFVPMNVAGGLEFVAVDADLQRTDPGPLTFVVMERRYVTSLVAYPDGHYGYEQTPVDKPVQTSTVTFDAEKPFLWPLPTQQPGDFLLAVNSADGKTLVRVPFTVAGNDDLRPALTQGETPLPSTQLRLRLDKTDYAPGDVVRIFLSAPYDGAGLITLERDTVAAHQWFSAKAGNSVHELTIPGDFEGRGYINISMGRALSSPEIFMQPHAYAVTPLNVNAAGRDQQLRLESAAGPAQPGMPLKVRVSAAKPGKVVVFAVDEGVLQLTRFVTPNPLNALLLDRALEVNTTQLFDLVMPDPAQIARRLAAFGGGMDRSGGLLLNPFKRKNEPPLAWWSDVLDVGPEARELSIPVPDYYNGQVRLMAVAASPDTVGSAQAEAVVRNELVVTPQAPLFVAPGDRFEAAVAVANTSKTARNLTLKLAVTAGLQVEKGLPEQLELAAGAETTLPLQLTATDSLGNAAFTVSLAAADGTLTARTANLSVRPASALRHTRSGGVANAAAVLPAARTVYPYLAESSVSVGTTPLPALRGLLGYLRTYPYGCTEQRLSRAFPLLLLAGKPNLLESLRTGPESPEEARKAERETLDAALSAIRAGLRLDEGIAPWPDFSTVDRLVTAYAGDYLLAMREAGFTVPGDLETSFFSTLLQSTASMPQSLQEARAQAYGLWVLTRMGHITTATLEQLNAYLDENYEHWRTDIVATFMAGSYAVMRMDVQADELVRGFDPAGLKNTYGPLDMTAAQALRVAVLARHFPSLLRGQTEELAARLLERLNVPYGTSTFAAAQATRALLLVADMGKADNASGLVLQCTRMQPGFAALVEAQPLLQEGLLLLDAPGCAEFSLAMSGQQPVFWEVNTRGYDRTVPVKADAQGLEVTRRYSTAAGVELHSGDSVPQGSVVTVTLGLRVFGEPFDGTVPVVVSDLFPGGFELVLQHPEDTQPDAAMRADRREDRVILHASVPAAASASTPPAQWVYHLRAVSRGVFTMPAVQAEGMYNRSLLGHTAGGTLAVQ